MQILVNSNHSTDASSRLEERIQASLKSEMAHFEDRLTRIEVHLSDENGPKHGPQNKRCQMEARIKAHDPVSVTHKADSFDLAIDGAANKLNHALAHAFGKLDRR